MSPRDHGARRAVVAGNVALDEVWRDGTLERQARGGTATYACLALRALGVPVSLVGAVGVEHADLLRVDLAAAGVDLDRLRIEAGSSTRFRLDYRGSSRDERLVAPGPVTTARHVSMPPTGLAFVHLGAVAGELAPDAVEAFAAWGAPLGVDLHALRRFDATGALSLVDAVTSGVPFERIDTVKGSVAELRAFAPTARDVGGAMEAVAAHGVRHVFATDGAAGALLYIDERFWLVPAHPTVEVDATGAGDVFLAAFLAARFVLAAEPADASAFAAAAASFVVEGPGASTLGNEPAVRARAARLRVREPTAAERRSFGA
jgi:sugar/nucleoside kinase (ribokinase family)